MAVSARFGRDLEACIAQVERSVADARERGAALVVLPEAALGGYLYEPHVAGAPAPCAPPPALRRDGEEIARIARIAGDVVVCVGYTEDAPGGPYSSAVCVSGDGILGHHRKVHLPPGERGVLNAGSGFAAFDTPIGRIGMLVCYDKTFPEAARAARARRRRPDRVAVGVGGVPRRPRARGCAATCRCATSTCSTRRARSRTRSCGSPPTRSGASAGCASRASRRSSTRAAACWPRPARGRASRWRASTPRRRRRGAPAPVLPRRPPSHCLCRSPRGPRMTA